MRKITEMREGTKPWVLNLQKMIQRDIDSYIQYMLNVKASKMGEED
jgi:hypothetical protein